MGLITRFVLIIMVLIGAFFTKVVVVDAQGRNEVALSALERTPHVPNQVLVQFRYGVTDEAKEALRGRVSTQTEDVVVSQDRRSDFKGDLELWNLPPGLAIAQAVRDLQ